MLYPQSNKFRTTLNLNGIWEYKTVADDYIPIKKADKTSPMAVPSSINDIVTDKKIADYVGKVLFETEFSLPVSKSENYRLRIGAASHKCEVYLNGEKIGEGINGFIPVDLPLKNLKENNRLSVIVDNRLTNHTLPMGAVEPDGKFCVTTTSGPYTLDVSDKFSGEKQIIKFDFYNFTGIHRDVIVYSVPKNNIEDVIIKTVVDGDYRKISVETKTEGKIVRYTVYDGERIVASSKTGDITIENPVLWSCENPHLYTLLAETENDCYRQRFGIRKVSFDKNGLYLNDKPVYLKGFGKHEDFNISGKGNNSAVNVRDFELLKWINANSVRTSHYPYAEEILDLADRYGIMVIDECPAAGVGFWSGFTFGKGRAGDDLLKLHKQVVSSVIERDKNHPSVIMLSVANETATYEEKAMEYYREVITHAKKLTDLPITIVESTKASEPNYCADLVDIMCLNRYYGWYDEFANLNAVEWLYKDEFEKYHDRYGKPIILTEFGAEALSGFHSLTAEAFSEEYQKALIEKTCDVIDEIPYVIGEHVWNFADFKTREGVLRPGGNRKGVFTKDRQPKLSAYYLRERWQNKIEK